MKIQNDSFIADQRPFESSPFFVSLNLTRFRPFVRPPSRDLWRISECFITTEITINNAQWRRESRKHGLKLDTIWKRSEAHGIDET